MAPRASKKRRGKARGKVQPLAAATSAAKGSSSKAVASGDPAATQGTSTVVAAKKPAAEDPASLQRHREIARRLTVYTHACHRLWHKEMYLLTDFREYYAEERRLLSQLDVDPGDAAAGLTRGAFERKAGLMSRLESALRRRTEFVLRKEEALVCAITVAPVAKLVSLMGAFGLLVPQSD